MSTVHLEWNPFGQQLDSRRALVEELRRDVVELRAENAELRRENAELRQQVNGLRCDVGYWKSRHADAVERNTKLQAELDEAKAEIRSLKRNASVRKRKSSQPAIVRIGSMIQRRRRPRRRNEGGSLEVRHRSVEITRTSPHAFRKSMFRTTPKSVLAVVCRWRDWGSMKTANKSKSKR